MLKERMETGKILTDSLLHSHKYYFSELKPSDLENGLAAVYAIFNKGDEQALYVGRTKNIRQRIYNNHLMGPLTNARLKKYLIDDDTLDDIKDAESAKKYIIDNCYFQYIAVEDITTRGQIEGLLSYLLDVRYIYEEH